MNETTTQATHELLLGVNKQLTQLGEQLLLIAGLLRDMRVSEGAPRLGLCAECVADWMQAGSDPEAIITPALAWIATPAGYPAPVCIVHFETFLKVLKTSKLLLPGR